MWQNCSHFLLWQRVFVISHPFIAVASLHITLRHRVKADKAAYERRQSWVCLVSDLPSLCKCFHRKGLKWRDESFLVTNIVTQKITSKLIEGVFAWLNSYNCYLQCAQILWFTGQISIKIIVLCLENISGTRWKYSVMLSMWLQDRKELQVKKINKKTKTEWFQMLFISD